MSEDYALFQDRREIAHNDWQRNFVLPYGSAYNTAVGNFRKVLQEQEDADRKARERYLELAFFALSMCGGSILTSVFGSAALKDAAAAMTVDALCRYEMHRSFKAATLVAENKTAQFALGALWDGLEGAAGGALKAKIIENASNFPSLGKFVQEPLNMQNSLEQFVRDAYNIVMQAGSAIHQQEKDAARKARALRQLSQSAFFVAAPAKRKDEAAISIDIELAFLMKTILELDYVKVWKSEHSDLYEHKTTLISRTPIEQLPASKAYPKPHVTRVQSSAPYAFVHHDIDYSPVGEVIVKRIDELHQARFKQKFFNNIWTGVRQRREDVSHEMLVRAQFVLKRLADRNLQAVEAAAKTMARAA